MKNILKMLFGGDFQSGVYDNGGKVDTKLSISEVEKIARATANALGSEFSVTKGSVDTGTFDLDYMGEKYDGGSYLILNNGDVVNVALRGRPIYYNYKTKKKFEFGGDFQAGVYNKGGALTNERLHVNKGEDYEVRYAKPRPARKGYKGLRSFDDGGGINYKDTWQNLLEDFGFKKGRSKYGLEMYYKRGYTASVDKNLRNVDLMFEDDVLYKGYSVQGLLDALEKQFGKRSFDEGGNIDLTDDNKLKLRKPAMPKRKLTEAEWMAKYNDSKEARTYGFGGLFSKSAMMSRPKPIDLNQQQVRLKSGEYVQVLNQQGDTLMVMDLSKLGTGTAPKYAKLSDVDMTSFKNGGALIGNQKRIDMNKNGKIDAEDFKILRASMNGAWRNERKHVNHNEDYEVRYAKKKPSRTGYKGKRKFGEGGGISTAERFKKVVAKNREGNRVKPTSQKMSSGAEVKKGNKGGVMVLAKKIRKEGESWKDALKRAGQQLK